MIKLLKFYFFVVHVTIFTANGFRLNGQKYEQIIPNILSDNPVQINQNIRTSDNQEFEENIINDNIHESNFHKYEQQSGRSMMEKSGCLLSSRSCSGSDNSDFGLNVQLRIPNLDFLSAAKKIFGGLFGSDDSNTAASTKGCPLSYIQPKIPTICDELSYENVHPIKSTEFLQYSTNNQKQNSVTSNDGGILGSLESIPETIFEGIDSIKQVLPVNPLAFGKGNSIESEAIKVVETQNNQRLNLQENNFYDSISNYRPFQLSEADSVIISQSNPAIEIKNEKLNPFLKSGGTVYSGLQGTATDLSSSNQRPSSFDSKYGSYGGKISQTLSSPQKYTNNNQLYNSVILDQGSSFSSAGNKPNLSFGKSCCLASSKQQVSYYPLNEGNSISLPPVRPVQSLGKLSNNQVYSPILRKEALTKGSHLSSLGASEGSSSSHKRCQIVNYQPCPSVSSSLHDINAYENNPKVTIVDYNPNPSLKIDSKVLPFSFQLDLPEFVSGFTDILNK